jgi:hypothetical protein
VNKSTEKHASERYALCEHCKHKDEICDCVRVQPVKHMAGLFMITRPYYHADFERAT